MAVIATIPLAASGPAGAQPTQGALPNIISPTPAAPTLSTQEIDRLVAPVALYPDQILTDILAASTYPIQVVQAQRFRTDPAHAGMQAAALMDAAAALNWDPSVKALLPFPQVLKMMSAHLDWTKQLGGAVVAQQADVMNSVQRLRLAAEQSGALASSPAASVVNEGGDILINPPSPQAVYLPTYQDPCVFGPAPACTGTYGTIFWGSAIALPFGLLPWGVVNWRQRTILLRPGNAGTSVWRHAPWPRNGLGQFHYAHPANTSFNRGNLAAEHLNAPLARVRILRTAHFGAAMHVHFGSRRR